MSAVEAVQRCWCDVATRQGCAKQAAADALTSIIAAYQEPHRHYHTLEHVAALLALLERHITGGSDGDALILAILLHDAVYDPARQDNEEASSRLAADLLIRLGFSPPLTTNVVRCILATRHDQPAQAADDVDAALLADLDLSILAAAPTAYRAYAQAIRREYAFVPDPLYREGRRRVLEAFLARQSIYRTARLRDAWERAARANVASELAELVS